ncbi:MAG: hypothetical protein AAFP70_16245, partial [Calditrichota bacterium]
YGKLYLLFEVGDASGRSYIRFWNYGSREREVVKGTILKVSGRVELIHSKRELQLEKWRLATAEEIHHLGDLLQPSSEMDIEGLLNRFMMLSKPAKNEQLLELWNHLYGNEKQYRELLRSPVGTLWHHNYRYGLLEHLITMLELAERLSVYNPSIKHELLKAGIIYHEIARRESLTLDEAFSFSNKGRLLGTRIMAWQLVMEEIGKIEGFPEGLKMELQHLILSAGFPGEEEGFPKAQTVEGIVLNHLIHTSAYSNAVCRIVTEGRLPGDEWTRYVHLLKRPLFFGIETP